MKKFVIKDTIINQETKETLVYFTGKDGYVHSYPEYADGFAKKGNAMKKIQREVNDPWLGRNQKLNENQFIEADKWLHTLEIVEIEQ